MVAYLLVSVALALSCLLLYVSALAIAIRRRKEFGVALVLAHALVFPLALAGYAADIAGTGAWMPGWIWTAWLYPAAFVIAAFASVAVMRIDGHRWWLWPIPLWNLTLGAVLALRILTYLGMDSGIPGGALLMGHAMVQTVAAFPLYIFFPLFNPLPVVMLPVGPGHPRSRRINLVPAAATGLLLAALAAVYPHAWSVTSSWRSAAVPVEPCPASFQPGAVLRVSVDRVTPQWQFVKETEAVNDLGLAAVNLFVHDNLMTDQATAGALGEFLRGLREQGTTVILTADFPENWQGREMGNFSG